MASPFAPHDNIAVDVAIARVVVEVDAPIVAAGDEVVADDVTLAQPRGLGLHPAVQRPGVGNFEARVAKRVVLDDVAAASLVSQVDGMVRHVLDQIMSDHVSLAQAEEDAGV